MTTFEPTATVGTRVKITLENHCFDGEFGVITEAYQHKSGQNEGRIEYVVTFSDGGSCYYWRNQFKVVVDEPVEYLPGGDLGMFPAAHPRPMDRHTLIQQLECDRAKFLAKMGNTPEWKWSDAEHAEAETLKLVGKRVPEVRRRLPANPTFNDIRRCW